MLAVRRILPKLPDVGTGLFFANVEPSRDPLLLTYLSRKDSLNAGKPASEGERELEGVEEVLRKCSVLATSFTSY